MTDKTVEMSVRRASLRNSRCWLNECFEYVFKAPIRSCSTTSAGSVAAMILRDAVDQGPSVGVAQASELAGMHTQPMSLLPVMVSSVAVLFLRNTPMLSLAVPLPPRYTFSACSIAIPSNCLLFQGAKDVQAQPAVHPVGQGGVRCQQMSWNLVETGRTECRHGSANRLPQ